MSHRFATAGIFDPSEKWFGYSRWVCQENREKVMDTRNHVEQGAFFGHSDLCRVSYIDVQQPESDSLPPSPVVEFAASSFLGHHFVCPRPGAGINYGSPIYFGAKFKERPQRI